MYVGIWTWMCIIPTTELTNDSDKPTGILQWQCEMSSYHRQDLAQGVVYMLCCYNTTATVVIENNGMTNYCTCIQEYAIGKHMYIHTLIYCVWSLR